MNYCPQWIFQLVCGCRPLKAVRLALGVWGELDALARLKSQMYFGDTQTVLSLPNLVKCVAPATIAHTRLALTLQPQRHDYSASPSQLASRLHVAPHPGYNGPVNQIAATVAAHGNSISVGLCQGYSAVLIPQLMTSTSTIQITEEESSWIASLGVISNPLGALSAGILMEIFGRKATVKMTSLPYLVGWILIALSDNIVKMYVGRFISGLAVGMATASYVYVAEISQAEHRGTLSAAGPIHVSFGVLAVYILGYIAKWQLVAAVCTVCAVLSFVAMCMVPESPPWLASQGRVGEAKAALVWLGRSPSNAEAELDELLDSVCKEKNTNNNSTNGPVTFKSKLKDKARPFQKQTVWKPFIILVLFFAFQEGSGIYIILYYAVNLFEEVGTGLNEFVASIIVGGVRLVMSIVGTILIRNFGRKTLAVASGIGMGMSMAVGGAYEHFYSYLPSSERPLIWIPLLCVLVHVCISMIGFLQLPWIMNGELFPLKIRGVMGGLVAFLAHLFIFTSVKTYPNVTHSFGMDGTLWFFSVASFSGALYCFMFLPETRGKTLHEIELAFKNKNSVNELKGKLKSNRCSRGSLFITENKPKIKDIEKGTRNDGFIGSTESIVAGEIPVYSIGGQYINNKLTDF